MRIPIYKAGSTPTSEAPGRSFSSRMSAQPFVNQALQKGNVLTAAADQVGAFSQMRYKAAREVQFQQKILAGEESLLQAAEDFQNIDTNKLGSVFNDGGKPEDALWNQKIKRTREELLADVRDKESRRILTQRFDQMELSKRYSLRGEIDRKIAAANAAARTASLTNAANSIASGSDIGSVTLTLANIGIDSERLAKAGVGNIGALSKQEAAVLANGARGAVEKFVFGQESRFGAVDQLREALRDRDPTKAGEGQYAYAVLSLLPEDEQAAILSSVGSTAKYIDAPTLEEQRIQTIADATADSVTDSIGAAITGLEKGMDVSLDDIASLNKQAKDMLGSISADKEVALREKIVDLNSFAQLSKDLNELGDPSAVAQVVAKAEAGAFSGAEDSVDTQADIRLAEFARSYQSNMLKMLEEDPMALAAQNEAVRVKDLDLSGDAFISGQTGIKARQLSATRAAAFYGANVPLLTNAEAQQIVGMVQEDVFAGSQILGLLSSEAGSFSSSLISQLEEQGLQPELIQAMYTNNPVLQKSLAQVSQTPLSDLKTRVNSLGDNKAFSEITRSVLTETKDLFNAYILGGGQDAQNLWDSQFKIAQKLASNYTIGGMEPSAAASKAAKEIFPDKDNAFSTNKGTYYIPGRADAAEISSAATMLLQNEKIFNLVPIQSLQTQYSEDVGEALNEAAISSRGVWVTNGTQTGLVLHYRTSDDVVFPVRKDDGTSFDLTFDELLMYKRVLGEEIVETTGAGPVADDSAGGYEDLLKKKRQKAAKQ